MTSKPRRWRKGDRLGFVRCPLCPEHVPQIIEAIYPGLVVVKLWCSSNEVWVYGCNLEPGTEAVTVSAAL